MMKSLLLRGWVALLPLGSMAYAEPARPRPQFGIIFNDDADLSYVAPDRAQSEALLRASVEALAETPVKTLVYCLGMGGDLLYYNTQVASPVGWRKSPHETPGSLWEKRLENARICLAQGADAVRTAGESAKAVGLYFIPSLRMNDAHFMTDPEHHPMTSAFWLAHRDEYTIKDSPLEFQKAYGNLLDYTHAAVRQHRLDTVFEALDRYADLIDGFELDFNRFQVFFPKGKAAAGAPLLTDLVRQVRRRLDDVSRRQGRPLYLFVRVPPSTADCHTAGIAIEEWIRARLVDVVSPAQIMTLAGDMPIADLFSLGQQHGVQIYPSLYPRTSWRLPFPPLTASRYDGASVGRTATLEEIRAAAAGYFAQGADGFYLFNFYNAFGHMRPHNDPLYRLLRDIARPENLRGLSKVYAVTKSYYHDGPGSYAYGKSLPAKLTAGKPLRLALTVAEDPRSLPFALKTAELRVGFRSLPEGARISIVINEKEQFSGAVAGGRLQTVHDVAPGRALPRDAAEHYFHLPLQSVDAVRAGANTVVITTLEGDSLEVTDLELRYDYHNDYWQLWQRVPPALNQLEPRP